MDTIIVTGGAGFIGSNFVPIATETYPLPAKRPKDSRLSAAGFTQRFGLVMPRWEAGVRLCMEELLADDGGHCQ